MTAPGESVPAPSSRRSWAAAAVVLALAFVAAHASGIPDVWRGDAVYAYRLDVCEPAMANAAAPEPGVRDISGCDTLYSHRFALDAWVMFKEAWADRRSLAGFLLFDVWRIAVTTRTFNLVDFFFLVWPTRLLFAPAHALVVLHLGLVALATASGAVLARLVGASAWGGGAAGLVVGGAGVVSEAVLRGQYPQAFVLGAVLFFAGMERCAHDRRFGVPLAASGATLATLLYWQNALILGVGALVWLGVAAASGGVSRRAPSRLLAAAVLTALACAPAALPVLETLRAGADQKLAVTAWGTPFDVRDEFARLTLLDEVVWFELVSPRSGWMPILPLAVLALLGVTRRSAPWVAVALLGAVLALGPMPAVPQAVGSLVGASPVREHSTLPRVHNPVYEAVYRWVPTGSRMRHPMRWAILLSVGGAVLAARGADRLRSVSRDHAAIAVGTAALWTAGVGPWPLPRTPFPAELVAAFEDCEALVFVRELDGGAQDDVQRLQGLLWLPRSPPPMGRNGEGRATPRYVGWALGVQRAVNDRMFGPPPGRPPAPSGLLAGACVVEEPLWNARDREVVHVALERAFGPPATTVRARYIFANPEVPRTMTVYRAAP